MLRVGANPGISGNADPLNPTERFLAGESSDELKPNRPVSDVQEREPNRDPMKSSGRSARTKESRCNTGTNRSGKRRPMEALQFSRPRQRFRPHDTSTNLHCNLHLVPG